MCALRQRTPTKPPVALFFFNDTATTEIYTLSLHDALPISKTTHPALSISGTAFQVSNTGAVTFVSGRSEEHTSELQSRLHLVCRLLLEKKKSRRTARWARSGSPGSHATCAPPWNPRRGTFA